MHPSTDMGHNGVERERAVAAEHLDDDAEVQRRNQPCNHNKMSSG